MMENYDLAGLEALDFDKARTILEPERAQPGYWVGCPSVFHDRDRSRFLMTYRHRRPRGESSERGWRCAIAESSDGVTFEDIWSIEKHVLNTPSMERFAVIKNEGGYQLYFSYVDPVDNRWRIDVAHASDPARFDVSAASPVLTAESTGTEGVKDPHPVIVGDELYLFASYATPAGFSASDRARAHETADIFTTGMTTFPTGLAVGGTTGDALTWRPDVLPVGAEWDAYTSRLGAVARTAAGYVGLYDGSADAGGNYEERTGIAVSPDLLTWKRLSTDQPWAESPHGRGSLRYADIVDVGDEWLCYFEQARPDGAHDLRVARVGKR